MLLNAFLLITIFKYLLLSQVGLVGRFQNKGRLSFLIIIFNKNIKWQLYILVLQKGIIQCICFWILDHRSQMDILD